MDTEKLWRLSEKLEDGEHRKLVRYAADEIDQLRTLLREADRLLSLEGIVFDPAQLREQIADALNRAR